MVVLESTTYPGTTEEVVKPKAKEIDETGMFWLRDVESGSYDLPFYFDQLSDRIGTPDFVVCLDSGAGSFDNSEQERQGQAKTAL